MTNPVPATSDTAPPGQKVSRLKLVALLAAFIVPLILAAIWLFIVKATDGQLGISARGELIRPAVPLEPFTLAESGAAEFDEQALRGIWTMVYAPVGECLEVCQTNLYHMRQVRVSLGHRMDRVQRAVVVQAADQLDARLVDEHPGLRILSGDREALMGQVEQAQQDMAPVSDAIYLVDPFGNLMMRFAPDLPPKSMLKDIKHLLKVSRIG